MIRLLRQCRSSVPELGVSVRLYIACDAFDSWPVVYMDPGVTDQDREYVQRWLNACLNRPLVDPGAGAKRLPRR